MKTATRPTNAGCADHWASTMWCCTGNHTQACKPRSTTALRTVQQLPYRIDLAGGWLDQPFVSKHHPGSVITLSIEPTVEFNERSGMASSTRRTAIDLWGNRLPHDDLEKTTRILFCCDNPPGSDYVSGSQDAIGIVYPGLAKATYDGGLLAAAN